jgi:hypothetical protein
VLENQNCRWLETAVISSSCAKDVSAIHLTGDFSGSGFSPNILFKNS